MKRLYKTIVKLEEDVFNFLLNTSLVFKITNKYLVLKLKNNEFKSKRETGSKAIKEQLFNGRKY